jgi:hypothetical protein
MAVEAGIILYLKENNGIGVEILTFVGIGGR